jgi:large subunit ribosomal protein L20
MQRVKRGINTHKSNANLLVRAKGFRNGRRTLIKRATEAVLKAGQFAYRDRRTKKRDFRRSWISRINIAVRQHDMNYSQFMHLLQQSGSQLNRKTLAELVTNDMPTFEALVKSVAATKK